MAFWNFETFIMKLFYVLRGSLAKDEKSRYKSYMWKGDKQGEQILRSKHRFSVSNSPVFLLRGEYEWELTIEVCAMYITVFAFAFGRNTTKLVAARGLHNSSRPFSSVKLLTFLFLTSWSRPKVHDRAVTLGNGKRNKLSFFPNHAALYIFYIQHLGSFVRVGEKL